MSVPTTDSGEGRKSSVNPHGSAREMKHIWDNFTEYTTWAGLKQINLSKGKSSTIFWTLTIMTLTCITIWTTTLIVEDYLTYPVDNIITVTNVDALKFPSIRFCQRGSLTCSNVMSAYAEHPEHYKNILGASGCLDRFYNQLENTGIQPWNFAGEMNESTFIDSTSELWHAFNKTYFGLDKAERAEFFWNEIYILYNDPKRRHTLGSMVIAPGVSFMSETDVSNTGVNGIKRCKLYISNIDFLDCLDLK